MQLTLNASNLLDNGIWLDSVERWKQKLSFLPPSMQYKLSRQFAHYHINNIDDTGKGAAYSANVFLRESIKVIKPRFDKIFTFCNSIQKQGHSWRDLENVKRTERRALILASEMIEHCNDLSTQMESPSIVAQFDIFGEHVKLSNFFENIHTEIDGSFEKNALVMYEKMGLKVLSHGITPPYWAAKLWKWKTQEQLENNVEVALSGILKMQGDKWWTRKLKKHRLQTLEWLEIATGNVAKNVSPYASKQAVSEYKERQASCAEWMKQMELNGEVWDETTQSFFNQTISLEQAYKSGQANPENRRNELMLRMRHTEEYAEEIGYVGMFYTITLPSRFHANSDRWDGCTPKQANSYFIELWGDIRTRLKDLGCDYFGIRVSEPHADGTPHSHMALFMSPKDVQKITAVMRWYAIQDDKETLYARATKTEQAKLRAAYKKKRQIWGLKKAQGKNPKPPHKFYRVFSPRFTAVKINKVYGSATSYIAKYIAKNIDGFAITDHEDDETGDEIQKSISPIAAWASNWGIRQFGWQGSPSVMVYRELRKVRTSIPNVELEEIRKAADEGDWKGFVKAMGGMNVGRKAKFKVIYDSEDVNDYNEPITRIKGVGSAMGSVLTRATQWALSKVVGEAADTSWTCGNNCGDISTELESTQKKPPKQSALHIAKSKAWAKSLALKQEVIDEFESVQEFLGITA